MRRSWISWRSGLFGAVCAASVMVCLGADNSGDSGRYQLHVWAYRATNGTGGSNVGVDPGHHGAYRLDTQTGEVFAVDENNNSRRIEFSR